MKYSYIVIIAFVSTLMAECLPKKKVNPNTHQARVVDTSYVVWSEDSLTIYSYSIKGNDTVICAPAAEPEYWERAEKRRKDKKKH